MRSRVVLALVVAACVVCSACSGGSSKAGAPAATTTTLSPTELVPVASGNIRLRGTLRSPLPAGAPDKIDVVRWAAKPTEANTLPVVVRNNTADPVTAVVVEATATDASGATVATGKSEALAPWFVDKGQPAIGSVTLSGPVADGVKWSFTATGTPTIDAYAQDLQDLFVLRAVPAAGQITGRVENTFSDGVTDIVVTYLCLDKDGTPTTSAHIGTSPTGIRSGYPVEFAGPLSGACDSVLAAATGKARPRVK